MNQVIRTLLTGAMFAFAASTSNASVIYTFDVSDVSWAQAVQGDWSNMNFWFEFDDAADLNALTGSEVLRMGYDNGAIQETFDSLLAGANIGNLFGISSGIASLTVGETNGLDSVLYCASTGLCPGHMQVGQGNYTAMLVDTPLGERRSASAGGITFSHTYYSRSVGNVSIPGTFALLSLGLVLSGFNRRTVL
jgi:hypothetical protein